MAARGIDHELDLMLWMTGVPGGMKRPEVGEYWLLVWHGLGHFNEAIGPFRRIQRARLEALGMYQGKLVTVELVRVFEVKANVIKMTDAEILQAEAPRV